MESMDLNRGVGIFENGGVESDISDKYDLIGNILSIDCMESLNKGIFFEMIVYNQ